MRNCCIAVFFGVLLFAPVVANAETIILKSGKALQAKVIEKSDQAIKVDVFDSGNIITLLPDEVDSITFDAVGVCPLPVTQLLSSNEGLRYILSLLLSVVSSEAQNIVIAPEDARWRLLYYYHNKDSENLISYLLALLKDPIFFADSEQAEYFIRFFSAAFKEDLGKIAQVQALKSAVSEKNIKWTESIITGAQNFKALYPDTVGNIELLWADFRAMGDTGAVRKIVSVLALPETDENSALIRKAEVSLVFNCLRNLDVKDIIKAEAVLLDLAAKPRIEAIEYIVDTVTEISAMYQYRGYNYAKLNQYDEAFAAYHAALQICPDYSIVLNNLGSLYKRVKNDTGKYSLYIKAALYNNPEDHSAAYNLGIYSFGNRAFDESIKYYLRALEYHPEQPEYNHAIARTYQENGDVENAVKYFTKYLALSPHGEHEQLVRGYLDSVNFPLHKNILDPDGMLREGRYEDLERYFEVLLKRNERDENGFSKLFNKVEQLVQPEGMGVPLDERLDIMLRWIEAKPQAHFANLVLGSFYRNYAWEARGSGFSSTVIKKGRELFLERLVKAQEYLAKAYELNPLDSIAPVYMLDVARGIGFEFDEMEQWFQRAIKADSNEYEAYRIKLVYLMPKWHGSREQMFAFARDAAKKASPKTLIPIILAKAHWEMYWRDDSKGYFKNNPNAWKETSEIYRRILEDFPNANFHRNEFAITAYYAGDFVAAGELFKIIGDRWDQKVWDSKKSFELTRDKVRQQ